MRATHLGRGLARAAACSLAAATVACYNWRANPPLATEPVPLDTSVPIASTGLLASRRDEVGACYQVLRYETLRAYELGRQHSRRGWWIAFAGSAVGLAGTLAGSERVGWTGIGVGLGTQSVTWLETTLNPRVRAARQRAALAESKWVSVRRQMSLWEEAARNWSSGSLPGTSEQSAPGGQSAPLAAWQTQDDSLHQAVQTCEVHPTASASTVPFLRAAK